MNNWVGLSTNSYFKPRSIHTERLIHTISVQTRTGLTKPSNLPAWSVWSFGIRIFNWSAKPHVSLAQTGFRLAGNLDLNRIANRCLWLKLFLDWRQLYCYKFTVYVLGVQVKATWITLFCDHCESKITWVIFHCMKTAAYLGKVRPIINQLWQFLVVSQYIVSEWWRLLAN